MIENSTELVDRLRSFSDEMEYLEFKHSFSDFEKEGRDICALANSAAYHCVKAAYKVWGIDDVTHEVLGTDFKPRQKKKGNQGLEIWLRTNLSSNANFEFCESTYQGLSIVILKVWPAIGYPVQFQNVPYIRTNSSTQKIQAGSAREIELWRRIQQEVFEDQIVKEGLTANEVSVLLDYGKYFDLLGIPRPSSEQSALHYLEQDGLVDSQDDGFFSITNMGAILLARNLADFHTVSRKALRVSRYDGKGRAGARSEKTFMRGYALDLESAYLYIDGMIAPAEEIIGTKRSAQAAYPEIAVRELIVNSLIHQDFTITGAGPMVEVFDDRIEITNPGSLLVEVERIVNDPPRSRNEKLSALMRRFGYCEEAGSGWDKVIGGCEQYHLPAPKIEARANVRIALLGRKDFKDLTPEERLTACYWHACLSYGEGSYATNSSLRERFNVRSSNAAQVSRLIKIAVEKNLIKPVDPDTSPRYMKYEPYWA